MDREVIRRVNRQTLILVPSLALATYLIWQDWIVTFNVLLGGFISWLSLRELAWAVKKFFLGNQCFSLL